MPFLALDVDRHYVSDDCCAHLPGSKKILEHWLESPTCHPSTPSLETVLATSNSLDTALTTSNPLKTALAVSNPLETALIASNPMETALTVSDSLKKALTASNPLEALTHALHTTYDINQRHGTAGRSLLHLAVVEPHIRHRLEVVQLLVSRGANVDQADGEGETALTLLRYRLHRAEYGLALDILKVLVAAGANVCHVTRTGWSALAACVDHLDAAVEMVDVLLNAGASFFPTFQTHGPDPNQPPSPPSQPFNTFLKAVFAVNSLAKADQLIELIGRSLSDRPGALRVLVEGSLLAEGRFPASSIPRLVGEVHRRLAVYWRTPDRLASLARHRIRREIGSGRRGGGLCRCDLPGVPASLVDQILPPTPLPVSLNNNNNHNWMPKSRKTESPYHRFRSVPPAAPSGKSSLNVRLLPALLLPKATVAVVGDRNQPAETGSLKSL